MKTCVLSLIPDTHTAAELFDAPAMRDGLADERLGIRHGAFSFGGAKGKSTKTEGICRSARSAL